MEYRGFREDTLLAAAKEFRALGLEPSEIYAVMNLAGAKWRSIQIREGRGDETQEEEDNEVFHKATVSVMKSTMQASEQLAHLGHATEGERFMLLAISLTLSRLFSRGPRSIRSWLRAGDRKKRKIILSFAIGSCIIVEPHAIDFLFHRIVKFRYGAPFDAGKDISELVIAVIEKLGKAGYLCLNPITDSQD